MHCVAEGGEEFAPEYYAGRRSGIEAAQLAVNPDPAHLLRMSSSPDYAGVPLWILWQTAGAAPFLGTNPFPLRMAFFSRLFLLFSFFVLSFLAAAYGLRYRSRYAGSPPLPYFFFLPLLPFIMILAFHVYLYALSITQGFLLSALGFTLSFIVFCAVQGLLLFIALLVFARQFRS